MTVTLLTVQAVQVSESLMTHRGVAKGGSWGARDPPFCEFFLSKQPTTGGENDVTTW